MKHILSRTLLSLSLLATASAYAADGYVTGNVYMRAGPDASYPSVVMLGAGTSIAIEGCVDGWSWCDVAAGDNRGWVEGSFLQDDYRGQRVLVPQYGVQIGIPIISFVFATYWQDHYRNRPWYSERTRWSNVQPRYQEVGGRNRTYEGSHVSTHENPHGARAAPITHTATDQRVQDASDRTADAKHEVPATRAVAQHAGTHPRTIAQRNTAPHPEARQKKPAVPSKSDKDKHPDNSQH